MSSTSSLATPEELTYIACSMYVFEVCMHIVWLRLGTVTYIIGCVCGVCVL